MKEENTGKAPNKATRERWETEAMLIQSFAKLSFGCGGIDCEVCNLYDGHNDECMKDHMIYWTNEMIDTIKAGPMTDAADKP